MIYEKFKPSPRFSAYVDCYFVWHSEGQNVADLQVESPPNGHCAIAFNTGDEYFLQNKKYERLAVPKAFISGQSIYSYTLFLNGVISITGIVLKPTALARLFDLPTYMYTEERISLDTVFDRAIVEDLFNRIQQEGSANEKARQLDNFMLDHCRKQPPEPDAIDLAANLILEKKGMLSVAEIMENVFMSRRNFERLFFKKVGLSPKYYARLRRMSYLFNIIAGKKKVDWKKIFSEFEYYDQSHFIKDFIEFTGRTPQQYLEENNELANFVEKPKTQLIK